MITHKQPSITGGLFFFVLNIFDMNIVMNQISNSIGWTALAVYVLYHTNAVVAYLGTFVFAWLEPITRMRAYERSIASGSALSYSEYMLAYHSNFFVEMITCRFCAGLWIAAAACLVFETIQYLPFVYFLAILIADIFNWITTRASST